MTTTTPYTVWDTATGEIYSSGVCVFGAKSVPDGYAVHWGEALSADTHIFDVVTRLPILRETPRPLSPDEFSVEVNRERQRRIEVGVVIDGIRVTDKDIATLTDLAFGAQLRITTNNLESITFRDSNNEMHDLTPVQVIALWEKSSKFVQGIRAASWALKAMDRPPVNYTDDIFWVS